LEQCHCRVLFNEIAQACYGLEPIKGLTMAKGNPNGEYAHS
jgi:hypothetical protein